MDSLPGGGLRPVRGGDVKLKYMLFREGAALLLLAAAALSDLRSQVIHTVPVLAAGAAGALLTLLTDADASFWFAGFVPGALFLAMSLLTKGGIGLGDGLVLLALGAWLPVDLLLSALFCALLAGSAAAVYLLTIRHSGRNRTFPFIPFLFGGMLFACLVLYRP